MSLQSQIDAMVETYDLGNLDADAADGVTVGMVLLKEMSAMLEHLSDRMCRDCEGNGFVRNPEARYSEEYADGRRTGQYSTNDPEEIDCPTCSGVGFLRKTQEDLSRAFSATHPTPDEEPF